MNRKQSMVAAALFFAGLLIGWQLHELLTVRACNQTNGRWSYDRLFCEHSAGQAPAN